MPLCKYGPAPDGKTQPTLKDWEQKYRFFSHVGGDRRGKMDCQFFDKQKGLERFKSFDGAEANKQIQGKNKVFDADYYSFEATMGRILEVVEAMNPHEKPIVHPKHHFFGGGCSMSDRFDRSALPENDGLQVLKATRDALRPCRPQTAPAGGRKPSAGDSPAAEVLEDSKPTQVAEFLEDSKPTQVRPKSASVRGSCEVDQRQPATMPQRPKSASVSGSSRYFLEQALLEQAQRTEVKTKPLPRPKSAIAISGFRSSPNGSDEQLQRTEGSLQRPQSALAISGSRCSPSMIDDAKQRPHSGSSRNSNLKRSRSASSVSSCASTTASSVKTPPVKWTAEWVGGNIRRRSRSKAGPPRVRSKARAKEGDPFFPLCKDFSMYIREV